MLTPQTRRRFLTTLSLAGAASLVRVPQALAGEGALETTTVRIVKIPGICVATQYVAEEVLRAILKATDLCVTEPARVARRIVEGGFTPRSDYALATLSEVPYDNWREYDPEDTIRYYALRLHETGLIKSSPTRIIADGTDWRFFNELKRELKA